MVHLGFSVCVGMYLCPVLLAGVPDICGNTGALASYPISFPLPSQPSSTTTACCHGQPSTSFNPLPWPGHISCRRIAQEERDALKFLWYGHTRNFQQARLCQTAQRNNAAANQRADSAAAGARSLDVQRLQAVARVHTLESR